MPLDQVWVLCGGSDYDGITVLGVYSDEEKAEEAKDSLEGACDSEGYSLEHDYYVINNFVVDLNP